MEGSFSGDIHERRELRNRTGVFRDRAHAGQLLAAMLDSFRGGDCLLLAVPEGTLP